MTDMNVDADDRHVSRRELRLELRNLDKSMTLKLVGVLVVLKFDLPSELTAGAIGVAVLSALKGSLGLFSRQS